MKRESEREGEIDKEIKLRRNKVRERERERERDGRIRRKEARECWRKDWDGGFSPRAEGVRSAAPHPPRNTLQMLPGQQ